MMKMKKLMGKYLWVLVGLVIAGGIYFMGGKWADQYIGLETTSSSPSSANGTVVKPGAKKTIPTPIPTSTKSYTELVKEYEGKRIQFDERCQVVPKDATFKNGTSVLIDNRSASAKTVTVGSAKYDLVAYGYRIVTLSSPSLPSKLALSCGTSGNVGSILLQAQILQ